MTDPVRQRLLPLPPGVGVGVTTLRGTHYTPSARSHHWNGVRCAAGLGQMDLYTCTRHYFAWYAWNVLELKPHEIALQLGHRDGGQLVRKRYGHADGAIARQRIREAFDAAPPRLCRPSARRVRESTRIVKTCSMCRRSRHWLDGWYVVVHQSLVGVDEWEETHKLKVCSWACLRLAYMADEPGERPSPEAWKGEG